MSETIFTRIIRGEIPSHRVYEDEKVFAFLDIAPLENPLVKTLEPPAQQDHPRPRRKLAHPRWSGTGHGAGGDHPGRHHGQEGGGHILLWPSRGRCRLLSVAAGMLPGQPAPNVSKDPDRTMAAEW